MTIEMTAHLKRAIALLAEGSSPAGPRGIGLTPVQAADLLSALPADLVAAATAEMPKERGLYVGPGGTQGAVWRVDALRHDGGDPTLYREGGSDVATPADGPFRRLVAEGDRLAHIFTGEELYKKWFYAEGSATKGWEALATFVNTYPSKEA